MAEESSKERAPVGIWHVAIVLIAVGGLLLALWIVVAQFDEANDVVAVLGVVFPGLAAIGTAAFGVPLAYQSGRAGKEEAVEQGKTQRQQEIKLRLERAMADDAGGVASMGAGGGGGDRLQRMREVVDSL